MYGASFIHEQFFSSNHMIYEVWIEGLSVSEESKQSIKSFWVNDSGLHLRTHLFSKGYRLLARIGGFLRTKMKGNSPWQLCGWIFQQMKWHGCIIGAIHKYTYGHIIIWKNEKKSQVGPLQKIIKKKIIEGGSFQKIIIWHDQKKSSSFYF